MVGQGTALRSSVQPLGSVLHSALFSHLCLWVLGEVSSIQTRPSGRRGLSFCKLLSEANLL